MLSLGIIGTNWITKQFVDAGAISETFTVTHIYSRTEEKAKDFAQPINKDTAISTDLKEFFGSNDFDVVYIASPNSLHFEQVKMAIKNNKHVIVEKPTFSTTKEFQEIEELLENSNVYLFEAARHIHEDSFNKVAEYINEHKEKLSGASLTYMKYSSRYDNVLAGEEPNVFSPKFSGGALYDLGVYTVYDSIVWFGKPQSVSYQPEIISTGIDGSGVATLKYPNFDVNILVGKTKDSYIPSEIYFGKDTLWLDNAGTIRDVQLKSKLNSKKIETISNENPMVDESLKFAEIINTKNDAEFKKLFSYAKDVNEVIYKLRKDADIKFAADQV